MADELRIIDNDVTQYIVVGLGNEQYGIDIKYIDNIVRMQRITRVPKSAGYFRGVINLRGEVVPVMSLRIKMGLPEDEITVKMSEHAKRWTTDKVVCTCIGCMQGVAMSEHTPVHLLDLVTAALPEAEGGAR